MTHYVKHPTPAEVFLTFVLGIGYGLLICLAMGWL